MLRRRPRLQPPRDPNARSWSVRFIGGKRIERLGTVEAVDEMRAIDAAPTLFGLDNLRRKDVGRPFLGKVNGGALDSVNE